MIFATILMLKRLPQSKPASFAAVFLLIVFGLGGLAGMGYYYQNFKQDRKYVDLVRGLNEFQYVC